MVFWVAPSMEIGGAFLCATNSPAMGKIGVWGPTACWVSIVTHQKTTTTGELCASCHDYYSDFAVEVSCIPALLSVRLQCGIPIYLMPQSPRLKSRMHVQHAVCVFDHIPAPGPCLACRVHSIIQNLAKMNSLQSVTNPPKRTTGIRWYQLFMVACLLLATSPLQATHLLGGNITYTHMFGSTYNFRVEIYHDCHSDLPISEDLTFFCPTSGFQTDIPLTVMSTTEIIDWCNPALSNCNGGTNYGMARTTMEGAYTFPQECDSWRIWWRDSQRETQFSPGVGNINTGSSVERLYLYARLNNVGGAVNNSVQFPVDPPVFLQPGQTVTLPAQFTEADGDVVTCTPSLSFDNWADPVPWESGFNLTDPLNSNIGYTVDAATGDMTFNPTGIQALNLNVLFEEHRGGTLIGSTIHEIFVVSDPTSYNLVWNPATAQGDITITSNTVWDATTVPSGVKRLNGTLTIMPGAKLTVESSVTVEFGPMEGKCIVHPGGELILDGSTMRGVPECINMWDGIEVWGQCNTPGSLEMLNGATVRDAHIGVLVGKSCSGCPGGHDPTYGFGKMDAADSYFTKNAVGVKYASSFCTCNNIKNCQFTGGTLLDSRYDASNTALADQYPDATNPHFAPSNATGRSAYGVWSIDAGAHSIQSCVFSNHETAIEGHDSYPKVDKNGSQNQIINCERGINLLFTAGAGGFPVYVRGQLFTDVVMPITIANAVYATVSSNVITNAVGSASTVGIHLDNLGGFMALDNTVARATYGMVIESSSTQGGLVGAWQDGNEFTNCWRGIQTQGPNDNLQIRCARFTPDASDYSANWLVAGSLPDQGYFDSADPLNVKNPAGNEFFTASSKEITSFNQFTYYRHTSPASAEPTPAGLLAAGDIYDTGTPKTAASCGLAAGPGFTTLAASSANKVKMLQAEKTNVGGTIDKGATSALLQMLKSPKATSSAIRKQLLASSPLSDAVLTAYLDRSGLADADVVQVMRKNTPVSSTVEPILATRMKSMSQTHQSDILSVAVSNPFVRTLTAIENELHLNEQDYRVYKSAEISELLDNPQTLQDVINMLEAESGQWAKRALIPMYLELGREKGRCQGGISKNDLKETEKALNSILVQDAADAEWVALVQMAIDLKLVGKTIYDIDHNQELMLRQACANSHESKASTAAHCWLKIVKGEPIPLHLAGAPNKFADAAQAQETSSAASNLKFQPNPFGESTQVNLKLSADQGGTLRLYSLQGRLVQSYPIAPGTQSFTINRHDLQGATSMASALYICELEVEGTVVQRERLITLQ